MDEEDLGVLLRITPLYSVQRSLPDEERGTSYEGSSLPCTEVTQGTSSSPSNLLYQRSNLNMVMEANQVN